jgi:photosystem II stability/assembly factor-like uncharacterized protein
MSEDGTKQTAVVNGGQIYVSADSANTWTAKESNRLWLSVAMSADGTKQTSVVWNGQIYVSTDSGNTWTAKESNKLWCSVAMSADGTKQTAVVYLGQIYVSTDSGNTWTAKESSRQWRSVAMSADGTKQTAVVSWGGQIYVSTDSGNTWTAKESNREWRSVAMSADGTKQTAVVYDGQIYVSTDSGNTWTGKESNRSWSSVAMSADGTKQTAVVQNGQIYVSMDSGNTWIAKESNRGWYSVAMSADGTKQTAVVSGGQIYIYDSYIRVGIGTTSPQAMLHVNGNAVLQNGAAVSEFSTDGTLSDNSDVAVPTEKAVKTYVDAQVSTSTPGVVPIGGVTAWVKSFPNTPPLPSSFVECNGQILNDSNSPYNGQTIPNVNGASGGTQRFLRGSVTSGSTGGSETHGHGVSRGNGGVTSMETPPVMNISPADTLPSFYEVVWIMRVK